MARTILIETIPEEKYRHQGAECLPFVFGLLAERGEAVEWWAFRVPRDHLHEGGRYVVDLADGDRARLAAALSERSPAVIVFHNRPALPLASAVQAAAPRARIVDLTAIRVDATTTVAVLDQLLRGERPDPPDPAGPFLFDTAMPRYDRTVLDGSPPLPYQPVRLAGENPCLYRRPVRREPLYAALPLRSVDGHLGCSFCTRATDTAGSPRLRTDPLELALRQIVAHQRASGAAERTSYICDHGELCADLGGLLRAAMDRGARPFTLHAMARIDDLLRQREGLERVLPAARAAGHRLALLSTGAENFSPEENARLNKGVSPEQIWACWEMMRDLAARFPETFFHELGFFAGILFTPWTRPGDLRENLAAARRIGRAFLAAVVGVRLQLFPGTPIAVLAEHDGLVAQRHASGGDVQPTCLNHPDLREIPWRFADDRTELLHRLLIRLEPVPPSVRLPPDDPLSAELRARRAALPAALAADPVELSAAMVDAVEALGPHATCAEVFAHVASGPAARACAAPPPERPRAEAGPAREPPRGDDLTVVFADRATGRRRYAFTVSRATPGAPAFRVVGATRVTYDRCSRDASFWTCAALVLGAARRIGAPPATADHPRWEALLRATHAESALGRELEVTVTATVAR